MLRTESHLHKASFNKETCKQQPYIFITTVSNLICTVFGGGVHNLGCQKWLIASIPLKKKQIHKWFWAMWRLLNRRPLPPQKSGCVFKVFRKPHLQCVGFMSALQDLPEISCKQMIQTENQRKRMAWASLPTYSSVSSKFKVVADFSQYNLIFFRKNQKPGFLFQ